MLGNHLKCLSLFWTILICSFLIKIPFAFAQDRIVLKRVNGLVKLDGLSDEPAWKGIEPLHLIKESALIALAVRLGKARLIDNCVVSINN